MARTPGKPLNINTKWFDQKISESGLGSQKALGQAVGLDPAQVSQFLVGRKRNPSKEDRIYRNPTIFEVADIARALKSTTDEVLLNLGVPVATQGVPVAGRITDDCKVYVAPPRGETISAAAPNGAQALIMQAEAGKLSPFNGAAFVWLPTLDADLVPQTSIGALCIVEFDDELTPFIGVLRKASRDRMTLELFGGKEKIDVQKAHRASPVLSIHFP